MLIDTTTTLDPKCNDIELYFKINNEFKLVASFYDLTIPINGVFRLQKGIPNKEYFDYRGLNPLAYIKYYDYTLKGIKIESTRDGVILGNRKVIFSIAGTFEELIKE